LWPDQSGNKLTKEQGKYPGLNFPDTQSGLLTQGKDTVAIMPQAMLVHHRQSAKPKGIA
jgi:hypothetical protein